MIIDYELDLRLEDVYYDYRDNLIDIYLSGSKDPLSYIEVIEDALAEIADEYDCSFSKDLFCSIFNDYEVSLLSILLTDITEAFKSTLSPINK